MPTHLKYLHHRSYSTSGAIIKDVMIKALPLLPLEDPPSKVLGEWVPTNDVEPIRLQWLWPTMDSFWATLGRSVGHTLILLRERR